CRSEGLRGTTPPVRWRPAARPSRSRWSTGTDRRRPTGPGSPTYHYWPTSYNTHIFEATCYFVPPENAFQRLQQELAVVSFKEYGLQDGNTLEATQTMLESRAVREFPLNDQEVLLRHLHGTARQYVREYQQRTSGAPAAN
ncbi:RHO alpha subunit C-terminal catalytic domain-containing protein, partial [Streptomyces sp. NPDC005921]